MPDTGHSLGEQDFRMVGDTPHWPAYTPSPRLETVVAIRSTRSLSPCLPGVFIRSSLPLLCLYRCHLTMQTRKVQRG